MSSGAAVMGSPTSGGYAGERDRQVHQCLCRGGIRTRGAGHQVRLGAAETHAYWCRGGGSDGICRAVRQGDVAAYLEQLGPTLTLEQVGKAITELAADSTYDERAYMLTPAGLTPAK